MVACSFVSRAASVPEISRYALASSSERADIGVLLNDRGGMKGAAAVELVFVEEHAMLVVSRADCRVHPDGDLAGSQAQTERQVLRECRTAIRDLVEPMVGNLLPHRFKGAAVDQDARSARRIRPNQSIAGVVHDRPEPDLGIRVDELIHRGNDHVLLAVELAWRIAA